MYSVSISFFVDYSSQMCCNFWPLLCLARQACIYFGTTSRHSVVSPSGPALATCHICQEGSLGILLSSPFSIPQYFSFSVYWGFARVPHLLPQNRVTFTRTYLFFSIREGLHVIISEVLQPILYQSQGLHFHPLSVPDVTSEWTSGMMTWCAQHLLPVLTHSERELMYFVTVQHAFS